MGIILNGFNRSGIRIPIKNDIGLQHMPPGIEKPLDIIEKRGLVDKAIENGSLIEGYWWHVNITIPPIQDIFGLANVIGEGDERNGFERIKQIIGGSINTLPDKIVLGLRFINKKGECQWQCFNLRKGEVKFPYIFDSDNFDDYVNLFRNYNLNAFSTRNYTETKYHLRNTGLSDRNQLKLKSVAVIGCGALGSKIADILAKAGIGRLELTDNERLEINNSIRHVLGIDKNGLFKVHGLTQHLRFHNFFIKVNPNIINVLDSDIELYFKDSDIGISTIANDNTEGYINEQAVINNKVMFYTRAIRGGKVARIFRVIPGRDACFHCLSLFSDENNEIFRKIPPDPELLTITNECNNPIRPASAAELKLISSITARIILDHLEKGESDSNHWIWSTEPINGLSSDDINLYGLFPSKIPPHQNCPYCNSPGRIKVLIDNDVLESMREEIEKTKVLETGGILLGQLEDEYLHIKYASGPGDKAKKTSTSFLKDKEYCQKYILEAHTRNKHDSLYLGEWHYHPSTSNKPSSTDLNSLKNIATSSGYLTENPVMIIFSNDGDFSVTVHPINHTYYFIKPIIK